MKGGAMKRLMALLLAALLAALLPGCGSGGNIAGWSSAQVEQMRAQYPIYGNYPPALAAYEPPIFERSMDTSSHLALVEVVGGGEDVVVGMAEPGGLFEAEKKKQESLGYEMAPGAYDTVFSHRNFRVEKLLWENYPDPEVANTLGISGEKPRIPVEEGEVYTIVDNGAGTTLDQLMQPGTKLVVGMLWGATALSAGCVYINWNFAYYVTPEGYLFPVSIEEAAQKYIGWTVDGFMEDLHKRMDAYYANPKAFYEKHYNSKYPEITEEVQYPKQPQPVPTPTA